MISYKDKVFYLKYLIFDTRNYILLKISIQGLLLETLITCPFIIFEEEFANSTMKEAIS
jgi:hypothetical protein